MLQADEVVLERELGAIGEQQASRDGAIGHRQHANTDVPGPSDLVADLGERRPLVAAHGPVQVRGDVAVAEPEPGDGRGRTRWPHGVEAAQRIHRVPGLAAQAPTPLAVDRRGEGVGHGVEVGGDRQPVDDRVVGRVDDRRDAGRVDDLDRAGEEAGCADTATQDGDRAGDLAVVLFEC